MHVLMHVILCFSLTFLILICKQILAEGHFLQYKVVVIFPTSLSTCATSLFGNCQCRASFLPFSATVRHGRATLTCQNHVSYEAFATVSLWRWASHSYLFRGVLRRFRCSAAQQYTGWLKKVNHYQVSSLNRIKNRH